MKKLLPLGILLLSASCSSESQKSDPSSVVLNQNKWSNPAAVPVCIINRSEISDELFTDVKDHVTSDYMSKAGIGFTGWGDCQPSDMNARVIRVTFRLMHNWKGNSISGGGGLSAVGASPYSCGSSCRGGTMRLDIGSEGSYPSGTWARNFAMKQTRATAVHEFGHAMGLLHEHERSDAPGCQDFDRPLQNSDRNVFVGEFDPNSIMNYCHNSELTNLSDGDVAGLKYLYPQVAKPEAEAPAPSPAPTDSPAPAPAPAPTPTPVPAPAPETVLEFGPFGNNESKVLTTLPATEGQSVSFTLTVDLESHPRCEYDHVIVEDARGWRSSKICRQSIWTLSNLVLPVKVIFNADPAVESKSVKISKISYAGSAPAADIAREAEVPAGAL